MDETAEAFEVALRAHAHAIRRHRGTIDAATGAMARGEALSLTSLEAIADGVGVLAVTCESLRIAFVALEAEHSVGGEP